MTKGYQPTWVSGDSKVICDCCGFLRKRSSCAVRWDQFFVCYPECWEPRQPQDFIRTIPGEGRAIPPCRPQTPDVFQADDADFPPPPPAPG